MQKNKILIIAVSSVFLFLLGYSSFRVYEHYSCAYQALKKEKAELKKRKGSWDSLVKRINGEILQFNGEVGIFIEDLKTGWESGFNEEKPFPSASMVKVPVMAVCFDAYSKGMLDLNEGLVLKNKFKTSGSGKLKCMPGGTKIDVDSLIELMITESDNTAANMLIELFGFDYLNEAFKKLGLRSTNIARKMMDFRSRKEGVENLTTAADLAFLLKGMYCGVLPNTQASVRCIEVLKKQKMRDRIPKKLPVDTVVAHKTGLENGVCHDAGIIFTPHGDILLCVLIRHNNKTARPAKTLIANIARDIYEYMVN